ncbi:MAG: FprA family A-type flavoprotein [Waddliaceae bacterium]|jgi:flavorubredoxin|nr:FprA family A-type flavoprotein [Waddliaceae bacterium]MBT3579600.1 FprA family A-type flavoprotein [Waddliaceae bacterium]MBT4444570.1 FprA family A-type flavoprotein [Waddliaceae bacterium]MBT6929203.1 FprA family A-type flavoprotein [Waddliaceae bacterium]MBT7263978.1 FprA family A-type flavoprotein [Waddliaceae bacterium]
MDTIEIVPGIYWVGAIDWDLRNFHGYRTQRGSTYNAYLIVDDKITLVDTVKAPFADELLERVSAIVDPAAIDYVVVNHVEMDHSGALPHVMSIAKNATVVTSPNGKKGLKHHYKKEWPTHVVNSGDSLSLGKRTLQFTLAPMVHWPDSMVTYIPEDKLLLPNDAFGQHIATSERFDVDVSWDIVEREAAKYYSNIVMPFGSPVSKLLDDLSGLPIEIIAPSHGIVWKDHVADIVGLYKKWASDALEERAVIVYDTMWQSTKHMAEVLAKLFEENDISYTVYNLTDTHISDVMTDVLAAKYICVGSPTLNNGMLPTMAGFLTYLKGLSPKTPRKAIAFGSYGWGGQSIQQIEAVLKECGCEVPIKGLKIQYVPGDEDLEAFKQQASTLLQE